MKVIVTREVQILSILMVLVISNYSAALSMQVASASKSHSNGKHFSITLVPSATQTDAADSNGKHFSITLVPSATQNGPVNISVNNTVVASNIDVTKKNNLVIPITVPDKGPIRICATFAALSAAQICTDAQNIQGQKNTVTLDLAKALAG
ncbi:MAG: hypothetical protein WA667_24125 [Candidatus Nitrosopolaris sp.]